MRTIFLRIPAAGRPGSRLFGDGRGSLHAVIETVLVWQERASQRHQLASLDDTLLRDIGLSRSDAAREASKPFWRP